MEKRRTRTEQPANPPSEPACGAKPVCGPLTPAHRAGLNASPPRKPATYEAEPTPSPFNGPAATRFIARLNSVEGISPTQLRTALHKYGIETLATGLAAAAAAGKLAFPYKAAFLPPREVFREALTCAPERYVRAEWQYRGQNGEYSLTPEGAAEFQRTMGPGTAVQLIVNRHAYAALDRHTDGFTETPRMESFSAYWRSPLEEWKDPECASRALRLALATADAAQSGLRLLDVREACWRLSQPKGGKSRGPNQLYFREATNFKISLCIGIYRLLGARWVLDVCAGWGDRALATAGCPEIEQYVGVDPNEKLAAGYRDVQQFVENAGAPPPTFHVLPFEAYTDAQCASDFAAAPGQRPHSVVISPPFWKYEIYSRALNQSYHGQSLHAWLTGWLFPITARAWELLAPGGFFAAYVSDVTGARLVRPFTEHMRALGGESFRVDCKREGKSRPLPLWIWQKPAA